MAQLPRHGIDLRCLVREHELEVAVREHDVAAVLIASFDACEPVLRMCRWLHEQGQTAILALTPNGDDTTRNLALESGADDCVDESSDAREVAARIRAAIRRMRPPSPAPRHQARLGHWEFDALRQQLQAHGEPPVPLTRAECRLLQALLSQPGRLLSRADLTAALPLRDRATDSRAVDLLVSRLRHKLHARNPFQPLIQTVRGRGYRLDLSAIDTQPT
ncbi:winged helix-turn-helix domain-containing protein [Aquabacterium parvum]|uniref:winged helix-turn-helix domain-containing protein n=1 Tax=Aquabacterium parvum TaxID=70584 RepID=UPI00136526ED|nr:winged helix-turn-helix domain-containing protein [Aquabacterium parvum]